LQLIRSQHLDGGNLVRILFVITLLVLGSVGIASATGTVPEIDPASGMSALALLSGAVLLFRGRRK
jgi:hypothetical protein